MKIELFQYTRFTGIIYLGMISTIVILTIAFCLWSRGEEDYIIVFCSILYIGIFLLSFYVSRKFCTYAILGAKKVTAYSCFHRKLCEVDLKKSVYYIIFHIPQGRYKNQKYMAISNEPFQYQPVYGIAKMQFIQCYDWKKIVILPYKRETILLANFDEWIPIE